MRRIPMLLFALFVFPVGESAAAGPAGRILGSMVAENGGQPIAFCPVRLFDATGSSADTVSSDANGEFIFQGLASGDYFVVTGSNDFVNEVWDDIPCNNLLGCDAEKVGDPIEVVDGLDVTGINFALEDGGRITGTITDATTGDPVTIGVVRAFNTDGDTEDLDLTGVGGSYLLGGLRAGDYYVTVSILGYVTQLYDGIRCDDCDPLGGTPVPVVFNSTTTGIDFAMFPEIAFEDDFETGDLSRWSSVE